MIGKTISRYRIVEKLGEGGMETVYKAEDTKLGRMVALKLLSIQEPEQRERFLREARAAAALNHPNICTAYEVDEERGFLAMELVEGDSLKGRISSRPLPLDEALDIAAQIAAGLQRRRPADPFISIPANSVTWLFGAYDDQIDEKSLPGGRRLEPRIRWTG